MTAVPGIQFTPAGLVIPTEAEILDGVLTDYNTAFGGGMNTALETPQGQLATSTSAVIADKNNEIATIVNQVDPDFADGRFQDGIARIYFLERNPATSTAVVCTLTGLPGTLIPAGTLALDTSGNRYASTGNATIGVGSTVDVEFQNVLTGPIPCAADTLNGVYQAIPGWDTINNADAGTLGQVVESRSDFELRRRQSVALNAISITGAIFALVADVENVLDVYVIDNPLPTAVAVGATNYMVAKNSVYVAAVGGLDQAVGEAIWGKKSLGCNYNGNTSVTVSDTAGYNYPYPTYTVLFERPSSVAILFAVEIVDDPALPSDIVARVKAAIIARFNGTDGTQREKIGAVVYAARYYGAIAVSAPNVVPLEILIGTSTATLLQVPIGIDERPTIDEADITVTLV